MKKRNSERQKTSLQEADGETTTPPDERAEGTAPDTNPPTDTDPRHDANEGRGSRPQTGKSGRRSRDNFGSYKGY